MEDEDVNEEFIRDVELSYGDPIKGRQTIGGRVILPAAGIDFNAGYAFRATDDSGHLHTWSNVKPTRENDTAIFDLEDQQIGPKP